MRKIVIEVPDKCSLCMHTMWSADGDRWTCPARMDKDNFHVWTDAIVTYAKPVKACRNAEIKESDNER